MVMQNGPVNVGSPMGEKNAFMAACTNTVAIIPSRHHIVERQEKLQNVAPSAIPVKTALNPYKPSDISLPGPCQLMAINRESAEAIAAQIAALRLLTASATRKKIPVTHESIRKT